MRHWSGFNEIFTYILCLCVSLIRSQLAYAMIICDTNRICVDNQIETVQNEVLRFIGFKCGFEKAPHSG